MMRTLSYVTSGTPSPEVSESQGTIGRDLSILNERLDYLHTRLDDLVKRVNPILMFQETASVDPRAALPTPNCELSQNLQEKALAVQAAIDKVENILGRLQL